MSRMGINNPPAGAQRLSHAAQTPPSHPAGVELPSLARDRTYESPSSTVADLGADGDGTWSSRAQLAGQRSQGAEQKGRRASGGENVLQRISERLKRKVRYADIEKWFLAFWFSPDGHSFAAGAKDIYLYDTDTGKKTLAARRTSLVYACSCSPDGVLFCVGDEEGHLVVYYLGPPARKEGETPPTLWEKKLDSSVTDAVFSRDGKWIATITRTGEAALHDAIDGKQPARIFTRNQNSAAGGQAPFRANGCHEHMSTIAFCDEIVAIAGGRDNKSESRQDSMRVGLWSIPDMVELQCVDLGVNAVTPVVSVAFRPDGRQLAVGTGSGTIRAYPVEPDPDKWTIPDGRMLKQVHTDTPVFWRNDLPMGAPATQPHAVAALSFSNTPGCARAHAHESPNSESEPCRYCGFCHRSRWLLAAGFETGKFRIIDFETTADVAQFEIPRSDGTVCTFGPDDGVLGIGGGSAQRVELHDLHPIRPVGRYTLTSYPDSSRRRITASCVSETHVCLVNGSRIEIFNRSSRTRQCTIEAAVNTAHLPPRGSSHVSRKKSDHADICAQTVPIALRPSGGYVACVLGHKIIVVYEIDTGELALQIPQQGLKPYKGIIHGVNWSPNGKYIVAWGPFGVRINTAPDHDDIHLLSDLQPGDDVLEFNDFGAVCTNCAINNRGNRIASCGYSDTVVIRSIPDGKKLFTFRQGDDGQPPGSTGGVCWSDDAKRLAYHVDKTVLVRAMEEQTCVSPASPVYSFGGDVIAPVYISKVHIHTYAGRYNFRRFSPILFQEGKPGRVVARFEDVDAVPVAHGAFSPGRGDMLLALEGVLGPDKPDDTHQILLLNIATQERIPWDATLRPCLPAGEILPHGIGWLPTVPAYTFETCTVMVQGLSKPYTDEDVLTQLFTQKDLQVVQCSVRLKKGNSLSWALVTLADHSSCILACEDGNIAVHDLGLKVSRVRKEKATESQGSFAEIWKIARMKAAEADASENRHLYDDDDALLHHTHHKHHHDAQLDMDVEDEDIEEEEEEEDMFGNTEGGVPAPLLLYGAADHEIVVMDMRAFKFSAEDGALSSSQLVKLSKWDPDSIRALTNRLPHAVNNRSAGTGDTVLHDCVRNSWYLQLEHWLSGPSDYTPIPNFIGQTALHEAIQNHNRQCVTLLFKNLVPSLNNVSSPLVTESLRLVSKEMPELTLQVLQLIELPTNADDGSQGVGPIAGIQTVREFHEKFYAGDEDGTGAIVLGRPSRSFELGQWNNQLPVRHQLATDIEVASKVIALADFVGDPMRSPFWNIVEHSNSDPQVFESKLLQLAVQFKWQKVMPLARTALMIYIIHFSLMCATLMYDTQDHLERNACPASSVDPQESSVSGLVDLGGSPHHSGHCIFHSSASDGSQHCWIYKTTLLDIMYSALFVSNSYMLLAELREVADSIKEAREETGSVYLGLKVFCSDVWNFFDVGSIAMVYWAMWAHYTNDACLVEQVGAMAIILNSISVLQLMRPFTQTGALIQTIIEIIKDIRGFWYICTVILIGFTCAFTVCEPQNKAFTMTDYRVGPFYPVIEVIISMIGGFSLDDYSKTQTVLLFLVFVIFVVIIMLNLLITIIGESYGRIKQQETVTMLKLRAEVIVEQEKRHPEWWTNTKHDDGKTVYYNVDTGTSQTKRPDSIPSEWKGLHHHENTCAVDHNGMPSGASRRDETWLARQQSNCYCRKCVYPRYLHFAEPAANSDATTTGAQTPQQVQELFGASLKRTETSVARLQDQLNDTATKREVHEVMVKMDKLEQLMTQLMQKPRLGDKKATSLARAGSSSSGAKTPPSNPRNAPAKK